MLFALVIVAFGIYILISGIIGLTDNRSRLIAPDGTITIETVDTPKQRQLGLSGRSAIDNDEGMMFVFDNISGTNCFWMKDMQFAIDMVWLDADKKVVTVTESVAPETYPESFCPESGAKYGLELKEYRANELGIVQGEELRF